MARRRNRSSYGYNYSGYHGGRSPGGRRKNGLKVAIVVLVVILALAVGVLLWMQQYMVYSADGVKFHFPWSERTAQTATPTPAPEETDSQLVVTDEPSASPTQTAGTETLHAVEVPISALKDGSAQSLVEGAGGNAALFDMKGDDGKLTYVSSQALAVSLSASGSDSTVNTALKALSDAGVATVARVSCFKDPVLGYYEKYAILTNSGYRWKDENDVRWASPSNSEVCSYLKDLCVELAGLGFDEIVLDNAGYPTTGTLGYIKQGDAYNSAILAPNITAFYDQVASALEPLGVKLGVMTSQALLDGTDTLSGQTAATLAKDAAHIWVPMSEEALDSAGWYAVSHPDCTNLLLSVSAQAGSGERSWCIMN